MSRASSPKNCTTETGESGKRRRLFLFELGPARSHNARHRVLEIARGVDRGLGGIAYPHRPLVDFDRRLGLVVEAMSPTVATRSTPVNVASDRTKNLLMNIDVIEVVC